MHTSGLKHLHQLTLWSDPPSPSWHYPDKLDASWYVNDPQNAKNINKQNNVTIVKRDLHFKNYFTFKSDNIQKMSFKLESKNIE